MKMMKGLFRRKKSCEIAKDRLKILLISDRVNCSPEMMELVKADIVNVISMKHVFGVMSIMTAILG